MLAHVALIVCPRPARGNSQIRHSAPARFGRNTDQQASANAVDAGGDHGECGRRTSGTPQCLPFDSSEEFMGKLRLG
jgi:hypothetical protein